MVEKWLTENQTKIALWLIFIAVPFVFGIKVDPGVGSDHFSYFVILVCIVATYFILPNTMPCWYSSINKLEKVLDPGLVGCVIGLYVVGVVFSFLGLIFSSPATLEGDVIRKHACNSKGGSSFYLFLSQNSGVEYEVEVPGDAFSQIGIGNHYKVKRLKTPLGNTFYIDFLNYRFP